MESRHSCGPQIEGCGGRKALDSSSEKMSGSRKAYINGYTLCNRTALMGATIYGHTDAVKLLMEHEGGMKDNTGWTALMYAALTNHTELVGLLMNVEEGAQNSEDRTALMYAAQSNNQNSVKLLLKRRPV